MLNAGKEYKGPVIRKRADEGSSEKEVIYFDENKNVVPDKSKQNTEAGRVTGKIVPFRSKERNEKKLLEIREKLKNITASNSSSRSAGFGMGRGAERVSK